MSSVQLTTCRLHTARADAVMVPLALHGAVIGVVMLADNSCMNISCDARRGSWKLAVMKIKPAHAELNTTITISIRKHLLYASVLKGSKDSDASLDVGG